MYQKIVFIVTIVITSNPSLCKFFHVTSFIFSSLFPLEYFFKKCTIYALPLSKRPKVGEMVSVFSA
jgi:hypothetical protein